MGTHQTPVETLERTIEAVANSYQSALQINNLESAALPNKRSVIEAYNHLASVVYMGFYSRTALDLTNIKDAIGQHLRPAFAILVEQIRRAVTYADRTTPASPPHPPGFGEQVVLRLFARLPELRGVLNTDVVAAYDGDPAAKSIEEVVFSYPAVRAITAHRIAHVLYAEGVPVIPRILSEHAHCETGIDIHPGAQVGASFFVDHGTGVVIGETSAIGDNVKLYQGVTLGALSSPRSRESGGVFKRHPTIESNVTIYAGATILGGDTVIGEGSVIGGNVWITRSLPPNSKVFGRSRR